MTAHVLSEVEIIDEEAAVHYRRLAAASIAAHGGRYLARAAGVFVAEGAPSTRRIVLCAFPSIDAVHAWYASDEYARALVHRDAALDRRLTFFDGVPEQASFAGA